MQARPRWGGSFPLILAFGKACAATKRHDTLVPSRLMVAAMDVVSAVYDAHSVFHVPGVKETRTRAPTTRRCKLRPIPRRRHRSRKFMRLS